MSTKIFGSKPNCVRARARAGACVCVCVMSQDKKAGNLVELYNFPCIWDRKTRVVTPDGIRNSDGGNKTV